MQAFILLVRSSMFSGWAHYLKAKFHPNREFVSLDAKQNAGARQFELAKVGPQAPDSVYNPATDKHESYQSSFPGTPDFFGKDVQKEYRSPISSFSSPRTPSQAMLRVEWDPRSSHARGGLGLHPPSMDDDHDGTKNVI